MLTDVDFEWKVSAERRKETNRARQQALGLGFDEAILSFSTDSFSDKEHGKPHDAKPDAVAFGAVVPDAVPAAHISF